MATLQIHIQIQAQIQPQYMSMNTFISRTSRRIRLISSYSSLNVTTTTTTTKSPSLKVTKASNAAQLKQDWLDSLSLSPLPYLEDSNSGWVLGVDPDASGALALLKPDHSAQVFDSPCLSVLVGGRARKRLDAKSIVMLLHGLDAPIGTTAYIEQSNPYPKDGKQGWWTGGFGYGLWIGVLVASGFTVVPVPSLTWKKEFELSGGTSTKDDSRRIASSMFPSLSSLLARKKDHGRAEALLIAAYGKGLKLETTLEEEE